MSALQINGVNTAGTTKSRSATMAAAQLQRSPPLPSGRSSSNLLNMGRSTSNLSMIEQGIGNVKRSEKENNTDPRLGPAPSSAIPSYPRALFYPMLPWGAHSTIFPEERLRGQTTILLWEVFLFFWILWTLIEIPFHSGFVTHPEYFPSCSGVPQIIDIISDCFFFVDTIVQMHAAKFVYNPHTSEWTLTDKLTEIRYNYATGFSPFDRSLLWDLVAATPFVQIACWMSKKDADAGLVDTIGDAYNFWEARPFRFVMFIRLQRVVKVLRLWRLAEFIDKVQLEHGAMSTAFTLGRLILFLFFAAHILGCIFFNVGLQSSSIEKGWLKSEGNILPRDPSNWFYEWVCCTYWAITTMTTIGYGDITGKTKEERLVCILAEVVGSAFFAWLAGTVTGILSSSSAGQERFIALLEEVSQFLELNQFTPEIRHAVMDFYRLSYPTKIIFDEGGIFSSLPPGLQMRMRSETFIDSIEKVPIFSDISETCKMAVCNFCEAELCSAGEELCTEGTEPDCLYIVRDGEVLTSYKGERLAVVKNGAMFGELAIFGLTADGLRLRSAKALTECNLIKITDRNFKMLMITQIELKVAYRKMMVDFLNMLKKEIDDSYSPIYDPLKRVHIFAAWQTGKVDDFIRQNGKIAQPVIKFASIKKKIDIKTGIHMTISDLKGFPIIKAPSGAVSIKLVIDWVPGDDKSEPRKNHHYEIFQQGSNTKSFNWRVLQRFIQTPGSVYKNYPKIIITVVYGGLLRVDEMKLDSHVGFVNSKGGRGLSSPDGDGDQADVARRIVGVCVPAPHDETAVAHFELSVEEILKLSSEKKMKTVMEKEATWTIGSESGPLSLKIDIKLTREYPEESLLRTKFLPLLQKHIENMAPAKRRTEETKDKEAEKEKEKIKKLLSEITVGVRNVLSRGSCGKGAATACSVEKVLEKGTEETIDRLRDMKEEMEKKFQKNYKKLSEVEDKFERIAAEISADMQQKFQLIHSRLAAEEEILELVKKCTTMTTRQNMHHSDAILVMLHQLCLKQGVKPFKLPPRIAEIHRRSQAEGYEAFDPLETKEVEPIQETNSFWPTTQLFSMNPAAILWDTPPEPTPSVSENKEQASQSSSIVSPTGGAQKKPPEPPARLRGVEASQQSPLTASSLPASVVLPFGEL